MHGSSDNTMPVLTESTIGESEDLLHPGYVHLLVYSVMPHIASL